MLCRFTSERFGLAAPDGRPHRTPMLKEKIWPVCQVDDKGKITKQPSD
jgi:hypothetical protein